jgi:hypothetical protein
MTIATSSVGNAEVTGEYVQLDGETYFRIANHNRMSDFFMSITGASDHWMFISSNGSLTAGRKNSDFALFPYASDDQISAMRSSTGSFTLIRARSSGHAKSHMANPIWEPFSSSEAEFDRNHQNIYKTPLGNKIVFEEINEALQLTFRYRWTFSEKFGFVRTCCLTNNGNQPCELEILDGLRNVLPYGIGREFLMRFSNLGNAYKKNELLTPTNLGLFYLSSIPSDRAEPSEGLKATTVWQSGLDPAAVLLSTDQVQAFRSGQVLRSEIDVRGKAGAYLQNAMLTLEPGETKQWIVVSELCQDHNSVVKLDRLISTSPDLIATVESDVKDCEKALLKIVASADGIQLTANSRRANRHLANTMFNVMRGGIPLSNYEFPTIDFVQHVKRSNSAVYQRMQSFLHGLPERIDVDQLGEQVKRLGNIDLIRLSSEYLPLTFGRRHGDPTRPWNHFSIDVRAEAGETNLNYQGNWRDIFQNWEALGVSFPNLLPAMVFRFVNATTADGYNPYRLTKAGFEWEEPSPEDPWANIGYWGDHQIIYLLKLMEWSRKFHPGLLEKSLIAKCCVHANIPYKIKSFESIKRDPQATIDFDHSLAKEISGRVSEIGSDGKLSTNQSGDIHYVSLMEKLLTLSLAKLSNFIPDGGIWLNTQRPEWNDANNALVGSGLSMVTTCYLLRWFRFLKDLVAALPVEQFEISREVAEFFRSVRQIFAEQEVSKADRMSAEQRSKIVELLSTAGSDYRMNHYQHGICGEFSQVTVRDCDAFLDDVLDQLEKTIRNNRRIDGLYHTYNLIKLEDGKVSVNHLYEMLEGQVAVLSSGLLSPSEANDLLLALRSSKLYRENQQSYLLYPDRNLPRFLEKNRIPVEAASSIPLVNKLLQVGNRSIVDRDETGVLHFNGSFKNSADVRSALKRLGPELQQEVAADGEQICSLFETVFNHAEFTGRSGTFFAYEGLGSIYWHMVSKLGLAVVENLFWAIEKKETPALVDALHAHYQEIRFGIGAEKSPVGYGAFPTDPYSHTPENAGVKQPGMTGQVKEDVLARFAELGAQIEDGSLCFHFELLDKSEMLPNSRSFEYIDVAGNTLVETLPEHAIGFTFCQVPIIVSTGENNKITVLFAGGEQLSFSELKLSSETSRELFSRTGKIKRIHCEFNV